MAFYKVNYSKLSKKYHPTARVIGNIPLKKLAQKLSDRSTVTVSDCYAVLAEIGTVMSDFLASGYSVSLEGLENFRYTIDSSKNGKDTPEEVTAADIKGVRLRFVPEMERAADKSVTTRAGIAQDITWTLWGSEAQNAADDDATGDDSTSSGGTTDDGNNPL